MAIFVDKTRKWDMEPAPGLAVRYFGNGKPSCHMWSDLDDLELIAFAKKLGLKSQWIQRGRLVHFDLIPAKRKLAVSYGAIERELTLADFDQHPLDERETRAMTTCLRDNRMVIPDPASDAPASAYFCADCHKVILRQSRKVLATWRGRETHLPKPDLPFDATSYDIVCRRDKSRMDEGSETHFNIGQSLIWHSPSGMEWGYSGSGPADFALNVLALFVGQKRAELLHQDFKAHFIAPMPERGGNIKGMDIVAWIRQNEKQEVVIGDE